jgi:hypothetical protein
MSTQFNVQYNEMISDFNVSADTGFGMWQRDALKVIPDCIKHRCF